MDNGLCTVDMNSRFLEIVENQAFAVKIYSVVNSLCELPDVDSVQILIDGKTVTSTEGLDISVPLTANEEMIAKPVVPPAVSGTETESTAQSMGPDSPAEQPALQSFRLLCIQAAKSTANTGNAACIWICVHSGRIQKKGARRRWALRTRLVFCVLPVFMSAGSIRLLEDRQTAETVWAAGDFETPVTLKCIVEKSEVKAKSKSVHVKVIKGDVNLPLTDKLLIVADFGNC